MQPLTAQQIAQQQQTSAVHAAPAACRRVAAFVVSATAIFDFYPDNWQGIWRPEFGCHHCSAERQSYRNSVAYGMMINTYQPEDANASLDQRRTNCSHAAPVQSRFACDRTRREHSRERDRRKVGGSRRKLSAAGPERTCEARSGIGWLHSCARTATLLYIVSIALIRISKRFARRSSKC